MAPPVTAGFTPTSITWISLEKGWLLGTVDCQGGLQCTALAVTDDAGRSWHSVSVPGGLAAFEPDRGIREVEKVRFADANDGWIFGAALYATHDGGATWTKVDGLTNVVSLEVGKGRVWAEAAWPEFPDNSVVYSSTTNIDDWKQFGTMTVSLPIAMRGDTGYVKGPDGGLFVLTATGFDVRTDPCAFETGLAAIAPADDGTTVAVVCGSGAAGSEMKQFQVSHDGGHTFTVVGEAPFAGITTGVVAPSPTTFVMAATSGASFIYRTTDGGVTWQTVFEDDSGGAALADFGFTDSTHGIAVLRTQPAVLLTSTDGGATWKKSSANG
jgi:hypothetical protein